MRSKQRVKSSSEKRNCSEEGSEQPYKILRSLRGLLAIK